MKLSDLRFKAATRVHRTIYDLSKGRVAGNVSGMPAVKLTTTGRKSGQLRNTMLATPVHDDHRVILVASKGGAPKHPMWYLNLRDNPQVTITLQSTTRPMIARTASTAEKAQLWPQIVAAYKGYASYQAKVERDIPVVILEPAGSADQT